MRTLATALALLLLAVQPAPGQRSGAPNVILFIGDGLGTAHTALAIQYARTIQNRKLNLESLMESGNTGYALPISHEAAVIDSAASATQMSTGVEVRNETVGVDRDGKPLETIVEWAEKRGLATGLVTTMRLSHATPAAFAAHQMSRYGGDDEIMTQVLAEHEIEVLLGGGIADMIPKGRKASELFPALPGPLDGVSSRKDGRNLVDEARARGYRVVSDRGSLAEAAKSPGKLLGAFAAVHLPYVVDRRGERMDGTPSLPELTEAALGLLGRSGTGFFVMIEGGRIDYAGHDNDAGTMLHEMLEFDEAIGIGWRFQREHPETLLIVTADHGTGGFSLTYGQAAQPVETTLPDGRVYSSRWYYPGAAELKRIGGQTASFEAVFRRAGTDPVKTKEEVLRATGMELTSEDLAMITARNEKGQAEPRDFREFYKDYPTNPRALLGRALARHTHVSWSTGGHTMEPVFTYGVGPGAENLRGVYSNTRLQRIVTEALSAAGVSSGK